MGWFFGCCLPGSPSVPTHSPKLQGGMAVIPILQRKLLDTDIYQTVRLCNTEDQVCQTVISFKLYHHQYSPLGQVRKPGHRKANQLSRIRAFVRIWERILIREMKEESPIHWPLHSVLFIITVFAVVWLLICWCKVSGSTGWPWIPDPYASSSQVQGLQVYITKSIATAF